MGKSSYKTQRTAAPASMPRICSMDIVLGSADTQIEAFLDIFMVQERKRLPEADPQLARERRSNRLSIQHLVKALTDFLVEGTALGLKLEYRSDCSCGYDWFISGSYTKDGNKVEELLVYYESDWCNEIVIEVGGKEVLYIDLRGPREDD